MTSFAQAEQTEFTDYVSQLDFNRASETVKAEVTVKTYVDGDTVHFYVDEQVVESGVLKARFLAVNTPECTGKIEEYGKKAAAFTREKLTQAESIWIESDNGQWNLDSTGDRHLAWVWYRLPGETAYRNLNLEILQNGLAIANSTAQNRYGTICMSALNQARSQKLNVYSGQKDPDFYYGDAVELTLKELRTNLDAYNGIKVAFNGVVTMNNAQSVYVESYDEETGLYYGMSVYYGHGLSGAGLNILSVGNEVRIVGTVQYYEAGGTWQVSGLTYRMMKPKDPGNIQKLSDGHSPAWVLTTPDTFVSQVTIQGEESAQVFESADFSAHGNVPPDRVETLTDCPDTLQLFTVYIAITAVDDVTVIKGRFIFVGFHIDFNGCLFGYVGVIKRQKADAQLFIKKIIHSVKGSARDFTAELNGFSITENSKTFVIRYFQIGRDRSISVCFSDNKLIFSFGSIIGKDLEICSGHLFQE